MENISACCLSVLNSIPLIIFVVDNDVRIRDLNKTAATTFGLDKDAIYNKRGGEVFHCLHSHDVPEGCGRAPICKSCVVRNSVTLSFGGQTVSKSRAKFEIQVGDSKKELELLITTSPIELNGEKLVLLMLEDISEFTMLKNIIPICMHCKKIRDDQDYWHSVEEYFNAYVGVDFSHGICQSCLDKLHPEVRGALDRK